MNRPDSLVPGLVMLTLGGAQVSKTVSGGFDPRSERSEKKMKD